MTASEPASEPQVPRRSTAFWIGLLLCLIVTGLIFFVSFAGISPNSLPFRDDIATSFAVGSLMLDGEVALLGPPSHRGGRHLGPIYYWYVALGMLLGSKQVISSTIIFSFMKLAALFASLLLLRAALPRRALLWSIFGTLLCFLSGHYHELVRVAWHSNFLLIPQCLFLATLLFTLRFGRVGVVLHLLSSSLLVQAHFSSVPATMISWAFVIGRVLLSTEPAPLPSSLSFLRSRLPQFVLALLTFLSWLPLLLFERAHPSNLLELSSHSPGGTSANSGVVAAISEFAGFLGYMIGSPTLSEGLTETLWKLLLASSLLVLLRVVLQATQTARWSIVSLVCMLGGYFVTFVWLDSPTTYYAFSIALIPALLIGVCFGDSIDTLIGHRRIEGWFAKVVSCLFLISFLSISLSTLPKRLRAESPPAPRFGSYTHATEIAKILRNEGVNPRASRIFLRGKERGTTDSYHYLLGKQHFPNMVYSSFFKELRSFGRDYARIMAAPPSERVAYLLFCGKGSASRADKSVEKLKGNWASSHEIDLASCRSCSGCRLLALKKAKRSQSPHEIAIESTESAS